MSDEKIIETADRWREQERRDKAARRDRAWRFIRACGITLTVALSIGAVCGLIVYGVHDGRARSNKAEAERIEAEKQARAERAERQRAEGIAWAKCVAEIGVDTCTVVRNMDRGDNDDV